MDVSTAWDQISGTIRVRIAPFGTARRLQDNGVRDHKLSFGGRQGTDERCDEMLIRGAMKSIRTIRLGRTSMGRQHGIGVFLFLLLCVVSLTTFGGDYLFSAGRIRKGEQGSSGSHWCPDHEDHSISLSYWNLGLIDDPSIVKDNINRRGGGDFWNWNGFDDKSDKAPNFGRGFVGGKELVTRDSRDWDKDDQIRGSYVDYNDEDFHYFGHDTSNTDSGADNKFDSEGELTTYMQDLPSKHMKDWKDGVNIDLSEESHNLHALETQDKKGDGKKETLNEGHGGWYNERGRKELRMYVKEFETSLKQGPDFLSNEHDVKFASGQGKKGEKHKSTSSIKDGNFDKALNFGRGFVGGKELVTRDSRGWDKDDQIRGSYVDYNDEDFHYFGRDTSNTDSGADGKFDSEGQLTTYMQDLSSKHMKDWKDGVNIDLSEESHNLHALETLDKKGYGKKETLNEGHGGWYNERGPKELRMYVKEFETSLKQGPDFLSNEHDAKFASRQGKKGEKHKSTSSIKDGNFDKALNFGRGFVGGKELVTRDSGDWDKDDQIRGSYVDYNDEDFHYFGRNTDGKFDSERELTTYMQDLSSKHMKDWKDGVNIDLSEESHNLHALEMQDKKGDGKKETLNEGHGGWYNERGRKEPRMYVKEFETSLKQGPDFLSNEHDVKFASGEGKKGEKRKSTSSIKDGNFDVKQYHSFAQKDGKTVAEKAKDNEANMLITDKIEMALDAEDDDDDDYDDHGDGDEFLDELGSDLEDEYNGKRNHGENVPGVLNVTSEQRPGFEKQSLKTRKTVLQESSRRARRPRHAGIPCDIAFQNSTKRLREPEDNLKFARFLLKYVESEARPEENNNWEPSFAGRQTLLEREESFKSRDQTIHCGFVHGSGDSASTGFDLSEDDARFLRSCDIAISSCIFGNSDHIHSPKGNKPSGSFKEEICFVMFVDQCTLDVMIGEGEAPDERGYHGSWKVVVVKNLPYSDARLTGKVAKFLSHRLFPSARYSIWLDSKLRLESDPILILEYFLWRKGHEYAISKHYDRNCVWQEVKRNKRLNKFNHSRIDEQFAFYQADGLTRFNASDPKKLLPSYVPEGSFIVRAHTPMSNLFSCLWFNEVNRFTPRDQLSFAYTYLKLVRTNPDKRFKLNMFKDCERKSIAKLFHHRHNATNQSQRHSPTGSSLLAI